MNASKPISSNQKRFNYYGIFIILFFVLLSLTKSNAQEQKAPEIKEKKKNEIGINACTFNSLALATDPFEVYSNTELLNGIYLKQHFEKYALRLSFDHFNGTQEIIGKKTDASDTLNSLGSWSKSFFAIGVEKNLINKRYFQFYWGFDLNLYYGLYNGETKSIISSSSYTSTKQEKGLGFTPVFGMRFTLANFLRLSFETNDNIIFSTEKEIRKQTLPTLYEGQNSKINIFYNPSFVGKISFLF